MNNEVMNGSPCKDMAMNNEVRSLKVIAPELVLDIEELGIIPLGTDEQFVRIENSNTHYISNYGRCISITDRVRIANGFRDYYGKIKYSVILWENEERVTKQIAADRLVLDAFYNYDKENRHCIWHAGNDLEDNYYLNLYPVTKKEYSSIRIYVENGGFDSAKKILELIAGEAYLIPSVMGVGYWGKSGTDVTHWTYRLWDNMLTRCYSEAFQRRYPHYIGCSVDEEWFNYYTFKEWCENNYYQVGYEACALDKDILVKGNRVYSKDTCVFVPQEINGLFPNCKAVRGKYPVGIDFVNGKYRARLNFDGKQHEIGKYDTVEEAFAQYKKYKEKVIKEIAEKYKGKIPDNLYEALMNRTVEIDD